jgi:hypothetical protein
MREYLVDGFTQLPYFGWDSRPETLALDVDECMTALFLAGGDVGAAAALLKVSVPRLNKVIRRVPKLGRLRDDLVSA